MTRNQVRLMVDELAEDARQADPPPAFLHDGPAPRPKNWLGYVQEPLTAGELARVRHSVVRGTPFGETMWMERASRRLGLESTLRPAAERDRQVECPPTSDAFLPSAGYDQLGSWLTGSGCRRPL